MCMQIQMHEVDVFKHKGPELSSWRIVVVAKSKAPIAPPLGILTSLLVRQFCEPRCNGSASPNLPSI